MILGRRRGKSKATAADAGGLIPRRRRRQLVAGGVLLLAGAVGAAAIWGENSPFYGKVQAAAGNLLDSVAQAAGFQVGEILVVGRDATPRQTLLDALDANFGDPIIGVDLQAARERVMRLPWVSTAAVERVLPDTLIVRLAERKPVALWQHRKQYMVIDREGHVLDKDTAAAFPNLLVVAGDDAPQHAGNLVDMLRSEPDLMARVESAMWVGGRRWNVFLDNGISIRLPEEDPGEAWHRLAAYERMHGLLSKNIRTIDMRLPDKLIVQSKGAPEPLPPGTPSASPATPAPGGMAPGKPGPARAAEGKSIQGGNRAAARGRQA